MYSSKDDTELNTKETMPPYPRTQHLSVSPAEWLRGPWCQFRRFRERQSVPVLGVKPKFSRHTVRSLLTILTELGRPTLAAGVRVACGTSAGQVRHGHQVYPRLC